MTDWHEQPDHFHLGKVYIAPEAHSDLWTVEFLAYDPHDGESVWHFDGPMTFALALKRAPAVNADTDHEIVLVPRTMR